MTEKESFYGSVKIKIYYDKSNIETKLNLFEYTADAYEYRNIPHSFNLIKYKNNADLFNKLISKFGDDDHPKDNKY